MVDELLVGDDQLDGEEEIIDIVDDGSSLDAETQQFNSIVGALEEILLDPEFEEVRESFCRSNCQVFEDTADNKLEYTVVFEKYTDLVESTLDARLKEAVPGFSMAQFSKLLQAHKDSLMGEVFDLLSSLGDFEAFKEIMLSYKAAAAADGGGFQISCMAMPIHAEEQEDGEERPDLDFDLHVQPLSPKGAIKR